MPNEAYANRPMKDERAYLTTAQIKLFIEEAYKTKSKNRDRDLLLFLMLAYTGRRVTEILSIRVSDLIPESKQAVFHILKKRKPLTKVKSVNSVVFDCILTYVTKQHLTMFDFIFQSPINPDKAISSARVRQIVYEYADRLNMNLGTMPNGKVKRIHPHTFRHSYAVDGARACKSPGDIVKLQKILEHTNIQTTTHYLQYSDEDQREFMELVHDIRGDRERKEQEEKERAFRAMVEPVRQETGLKDVAAAPSHNQSPDPAPQDKPAEPARTSEHCTEQPPH